MNKGKYLMVISLSKATYLVWVCVLTAGNPSLKFSLLTALLTASLLVSCPYGAPAPTCQRGEELGEGRGAGTSQHVLAH